MNRKQRRAAARKKHPHYGDNPVRTAEHVKLVSRQAMQDTMEQYVGDCAILVLNREFGFGPERLLRFNIALNAELEKWWQVTAHPKKGDKESEIGYQRTKFDEALKSACGKNYRYGFAARYPWIDDGVI